MNTGSFDYSVFLFLLGRSPPVTLSTLAAILLSIGSGAIMMDFAPSLLFI
jgi:hypothetical protein